MSPDSDELLAVAIDAFRGALAGNVDRSAFGERLNRSLDRHDLQPAAPDLRDDVPQPHLVEEKRFSDLALLLLATRIGDYDVYALAGSGNGATLKYFITGSPRPSVSEHPHAANAILSRIGVSEAAEAWALLSVGAMRMMLAGDHPTLANAAVSVGRANSSARVTIETDEESWRHVLARDPAALGGIGELSRDCYRAHAPQSDLLPTLDVLVLGSGERGNAKPLASTVVSTP
jgi:hypothetical protein